MSHAPQQTWAGQLHDLAACVEWMAAAMDDDDSILGSISGQGIANHLSALPKHIRDLFMEYLSDEAAEGFKADQRYFAAVGGRPGMSQPEKATDKELAAMWERQAHKTADYAVRVEAERDRYREALERIANLRIDVNRSAEFDLGEVKAIARAAVGGDPE